MIMRVICIDNKNPMVPAMLESYHMIFEGDIYTVTGERWFSNGLFYYLSERNFGKDSAVYHSKRFIPLSEMEEFEGLAEEALMVSSKSN